MLAFDAKYRLDSSIYSDYWDSRYNEIRRFRNGDHEAIAIGNNIVDQGITDIALVVPDHLFWFGKSIEQNHNESLFQEGSSNLVAIRQSQWEAQKRHYIHDARKLVINLSNEDISDLDFLQYKSELDLPRLDFQNMPGNEIAHSFARLYSLFYGITHTVGTRLIVAAIDRAFEEAVKKGDSKLARQLSVQGDREKKGQVSALEWIWDETGKMMLTEESMLMPNYNTVLSLLMQD